MNLVEIFQRCGEIPQDDRLFSISRVDDTTHVWCGSQCIRIARDNSDGFTVPAIVAIAECWIQDLSNLRGHERIEAAGIVGDMIRERVITRRGTVREPFDRWPSNTDATEYRRRFQRTAKGFLDDAARAIDTHIAERDGKVAPIPKSAADTMRALTADDDALFSDSALAIARHTVNRHQVAEILFNRSAEMVFENMSGTEIQIFFELFRRWHIAGRPHELSVDRTDFMYDLGYRSSGTPFLRAAHKLRDLLYQWSRPEPFKIVAEDHETGGVSVSLDVRLPQLREHKAKTKSGAARRKIVWTFTDFDPLLFPSQQEGRYHRIPTRPFAVLTSQLGNTTAADNAKTAVAKILNEITFGRRLPFSMHAETLRLRTVDFASHSDIRQKAVDAVVTVLSDLGIRAEMDGSIFRITPPQRQIEEVQA
jgi:hypothetical protein